MAFGNRVKTNDKLFSDWDSTVRGLSDNVARVHWTRGFDLKLRIGNMFEKFIARKGFLDLFYDLRFKFKDSFTGPSAQEWNIDILKENTQQLEHKVGVEYGYQFDYQTRLKTGMNYIFSGRNVPKTFQISTSLNCSF